MMTRPPDAQTPETTIATCSYCGQEMHPTDYIQLIKREFQAERERGRRVREETIEKCAKIAEELKITTEWCEGSPRTYRMAMPVETAEAIRALSRAESAPE